MAKAAKTVVDGVAVWLDRGDKNTLQTWSAVDPDAIVEFGFGPSMTGQVIDGDALAWSLSGPTAGSEDACAALHDFFSYQAYEVGTPRDIYLRAGDLLLLILTGAKVAWAYESGQTQQAAPTTDPKTGESGWLMTPNPAGQFFANGTCTVAGGAAA